MSEDWDFSTETDICELRAAGILVRKGKILLDHVVASGEYWLPGGHVKIGETTENALIREFQEELGVEIRIERLVFVDENFWHWQGKKTHLIEFSYLINLVQDQALSDDGRLLTNDEDNAIKEWLALDSLSDALLVPTGLKERLIELPEGIEHFVSADS